MEGWSKRGRGGFMALTLRKTRTVHRLKGTGLVWHTGDDMLSMGHTREYEVVMVNQTTICVAWLWMMGSGFGVLKNTAGEMMYVNEDVPC